jgi:hypothetical protein
MEDDLDYMELEDFGFDVPDVDIEYEQNDDEGCEGGACKI